MDSTKVKEVLAFLEGLKEEKAAAEAPTLEELVAPDPPSEEEKAEEKPKEEAPPAFEAVVQQVIDNDHPNVGKAIYNKDENLITLYLYDGWSIKSIKEQNMVLYIQDGRTEWPVVRCADLSFSVEEQRTCKFYTASQEFMERYAGVESKDYEFDRPHKGRAVCSNKEMIEAEGMPNPPCNVEQSQARCKLYEGEAWTVIRQVDVTSEEEVVISFIVQATRMGLGTPTYRLLKAGDGFPTILATISTDEHREETATVIEKTLNLHIEEEHPIKVEEVDIEDSEETKNRYFDYVLVK